MRANLNREKHISFPCQKSYTKVNSLKIILNTPADVWQPLANHITKKKSQKA